MFSKIMAMIRQVIRKMLPLKTIEQVEKIETPLSVDMINALDEWYKAYCNQASWVNDDTVKSMNLPAMIASEIARQVTLEMQWNITGKTPSYNNFKNAQDPSTFTTREVRIEYRAKAGTQAFMPGDGPGGRLGEIIAAPNQSQRVVGLNVSPVANARAEGSPPGSRNRKQITIIIELG